MCLVPYISCLGTPQCALVLQLLFCHFFLIFSLLIIDASSSFTCSAFHAPVYSSSFPCYVVFVCCNIINRTVTTKLRPHFKCKGNNQNYIMIWLFHFTLGFLLLSSSFFYFSSISLFAIASSLPILSFPPTPYSISTSLICDVDAFLLPCFLSSLNSLSCFLYYTFSWCLLIFFRNFNLALKSSG